MTNDELEKMEAGVVVAEKDGKHGGRRSGKRFWAITLLLSITVMSISLLIFCLTGKTNNMEDSTAYVVTLMAKYIIFLYVMLGALVMWCGYDPPPDSPSKIGSAERASLEQEFVVFICLMTLGSGKMVEVFFYTMSLVVGFIALNQLAPPTTGHDDFDMNHLWFIIVLGTVTGLVCLIPILFFFLGWFSILILTYVLIVRYNFPDKTLVEVFSLVSEVLGFV